jgi:hypothetical protein
MHDYLTSAHIAQRQAALAADARRRGQARLARAARSSQPKPSRIARSRTIRIIAKRAIGATA